MTYKEEVFKFYSKKDQAIQVMSGYNIQDLFKDIPISELQYEDKEIKRLIMR